MYYFSNRQGDQQAPSKPANGYQKPPAVTEKPPVAESKLTTYETQQGGFNVTYPVRFATTNMPGERRIAGSLLDGYYNEAGLLGFVGIYIPDNEFPSTNFSEAEVNISATGARPCDVTRYASGLTAAGTAEISGRTFNKYTSSGAAAGNIYDTTVYSRSDGDECFVIEEVVHSTNLANYDPGSGVTAYDAARLRELLDSIVDGFRITAL